MKVYKNIENIIGKTPILKLNKYMNKYGLKANIYAKLEFFNPSYSIKARTALAMINDAQKRKILKKGTTIIEPTSGNTGIALAMICASKKYKLILTMPESMTEERKKLLKAYGAKLVLTNKDLGMTGAIIKAKELLKEIPNSVILDQFNNQANSKVHFETTGKEIYKQLNKKIDYFIAGVGTGGTISGVGEYLKAQNKNIKIVAIEPYYSPFLSEGKKGKHNIQGIGAGFIPSILNTKIIDEIIKIKDEDAFSTCNELAKEEGLLVGVSSGAALFGTYLLTKKYNLENKNIVVMFPDSGERYLSLNVYD